MLGIRFRLTAEVYNKMLVYALLVYFLHRVWTWVAEFEAPFPLSLAMLTYWCKYSSPKPPYVSCVN